jgi:hypothetical protein
VFKKDELAAWSQDSSDTSNRLHHAGNRAQRKGTNNRIDATVPQRNALSWQIQKLDIQFSSPPLLFRHSNHPGLGFERIHLAHFCGIIVNEVHAGTDADLQDSPLGQREDTLTNLSDRLRIPQHGHKMGIDTIFIERHRCFPAPRSSRAVGDHSDFRKIGRITFAVTAFVIGL